MENSKLPAFGYGALSEHGYINNPGLTKREFFAAMAMKGLCADPNYGFKGAVEPIWTAAVIIADKTLKELEK